jgi:thiol-disulfide isomerase/thioredoxin
MRTLSSSIVFLILIALLCSCKERTATDELIYPDSVGDSVGDVAPNFRLQDTAGAYVTLSSLRGKYVLVDFWGTWCGPCIEEIPNLKRIWETNRSRNFAMVSVAISFSPETMPQTKEEWKSVIAANDMSWTHVIDQQNTTPGRYGIIGVPSTFLLDRGGRIIARDLRGSALADSIARLLQ